MFEMTLLLFDLNPFVICFSKSVVKVDNVICAYCYLYVFNMEALLITICMLYSLVKRSAVCPVHSSSLLWDTSPLRAR